jgi:hypothetical protein
VRFTVNTFKIYKYIIDEQTESMIVWKQIQILLEKNNEKKKLHVQKIYMNNFVLLVMHFLCRFGVLYLVNVFLLRTDKKLFENFI